MRRRTAVLLAAVALIAAGCGGGSSNNKNDYVKQVNKVGATLQKQLTSLGTDISGQSDPKGIASKLDEGAATLNGAADDLAKIDPPSDAKKAHEEIVSGVRELAASFKTGATQARKGDLAKLTRTFGNIASSDGIRKIEHATTALKDAGYKIEGQ